MKYVKKLLICKLRGENSIRIVTVKGIEMEKNRQQKEKSLKPLLRGIGRFLGILACIFVIKKVLTMDIPYEVFSTKENIICFLFLIIYQTCVTFWVCVPWRCYIQSLSNVKISYRDIGDIYFKSNMIWRGN